MPSPGMTSLDICHRSTQKPVIPAPGCTAVDGGDIFFFLFFFPISVSSHFYLFGVVLFLFYLGFLDTITLENSFRRIFWFPLFISLSPICVPSSSSG
jgi:hypothetical protein